MRHAVIFQAAIVAAATLFVYGVEGKQTRRAQDETRRDHAAAEHTGVEVLEVPADRTSIPESTQPGASAHKRESYPPSPTSTGGESSLLDRRDAAA